jgi:hypothetical protein
MLNDVGTLVAIISQLNTRPACAPVNASMAALRLATHDSGPGWFATPFLYDSFIHYSTPVYPGALNSLLGELPLKLCLGPHFVLRSDPSRLLERLQVRGPGLQDCTFAPMRVRRGCGTVADTVTEAKVLRVEQSKMFQ